MQGQEYICDLAVGILNTVPFECVDWNCIRWVVDNIKEYPFYYSYLIKIYTAAIQNNLVYLYSNNSPFGCPGYCAERMILFVGVPSYIDIQIIRMIIFTEIFGSRYCTCNQPYCTFIIGHSYSSSVVL